MENIYLRPVGEVNSKMVMYLIDKLPEIFYRSVRALDPIPISPQSYDVQRRQCLSTEILKSLLMSAPSETVKILGITEVDIFISIFTYVFGEAQLDGKAALISLARLKPEPYEETEEELYKTRMLKEAVHELGHTFGLKHCPEPNCVMRFANNIIEVDDKDYNFCPSCNDLIVKPQ